jgi:hypothetical protein
MSSFDEKDLLTRELRERSADVGGHPIGFDAVRQSARKIRRRRQIVAGAVAAVVAAVALPAGIAITSGLTTSGGPVDQSHIAVSPTRDADPVPDGPVRLTLDGLERGDDPHLDYLNRGELRLADGDVVQLEKEYQEIAPHGDGWVALAPDDGGNFTRDLLDENGALLDSRPSTLGLAVTIDGSQTAYSEMVGGQQRLLDAAGLDARSVDATQGQELHPVGYAGGGVLVYETGGTDPRVLVLDESSKTYQIPASPLLLGASATAEAEGLVAGMIKSVPGGGSCWSVVSYKTGNQTFDTCDFKLGKFSHDAEHVIGTAADTDGAGPRGLAVLDANDGDVVVAFEQSRNGQLVLGDPVWEDDEHVLATVTDGLESKVVRFGLDGSMEVASETVQADDYYLPSPIRFATQP